MYNSSAANRNFKNIDVKFVKMDTRRTYFCEQN